MQQYYIKELEFTLLKEDHQITQETISKMDVNELKVTVKWMHRKGDTTTPTSKRELQTRWNETKDRNDVSCIYYLILLGHGIENVKDLTIYPTAVELIVERRGALDDGIKVTMTKKAAS